MKPLTKARKTSWRPDAPPTELLSERVQWTEILPRSDLQGDSKNLFEVDVPQRLTHLRFHIYPDGGVGRLRLFGRPK